MNILEGQLKINGLKIGIVLAKFNQNIGERLWQGCLRGLKDLGFKDHDLTLIKVPGAFEIPLAVKKMAKSKMFNAIIALGCVIQGETKHFDYVCKEFADGISKIILDTEIPVVYELLMVKNEKEALERSSITKITDNKGYKAAYIAMEMADLIKKLYLLE